MTVLNQTEIMVSIIPEKFIVLVLIGLAFSFICAIMAFASVKRRDFYMIAAIIFFLACMVTTFIGANFKKPSGRYRYECLIDDTVPYTEIYDKYDVVEQRGLIWVLENKEK